MTFPPMHYASTYSQTVSESSVEERSAFIVKTYLHLVGAIFTFIGLEALLISSGLAALS